MKDNRTYIKLQAGFTLMELLISLVISSIVFMGISYVIVENSKQFAFEDIKLDSKVFANYVLDDIESTIVRGSNVDCRPGIYTDIYEITVTLTDGNVIYSSHAEHGISRNGQKIYNYDNTYDDGRDKYIITEMRCDPPTGDSDSPSNLDSDKLLNSSFELELTIDLFNYLGEKQESYLVKRYIFNPYIYITSS
jgi:prepilin-type N-terminal cleavage/methylation domain-containing protein